MALTDLFFLFCKKKLKLFKNNLVIKSKFLQLSFLEIKFLGNIFFAQYLFHDNSTEVVVEKSGRKGDKRRF